MAQQSDVIIVDHKRHLPQKNFTPVACDGWGMRVSLDLEQASPMADRMKTQLLSVEPSVLMHSPADRAEQTLGLLYPHLAAQFIREPRLGPTHGDAYNFCSDHTPALHLATQIYEANCDIIIEDGRRAYEAILDAVNIIKAKGGTYGVLVSHCPFVEASVATATRDWAGMIAANKGDTARFYFGRNGKFIRCEHLALPAA